MFIRMFYMYSYYMHFFMEVVCTIHTPDKEQDTIVGINELPSVKFLTNTCALIAEILCWLADWACRVCVELCNATHYNVIDTCGAILVFLLGLKLHVV